MNTSVLHGHAVETWSTLSVPRRWSDPLEFLSAQHRFQSALCDFFNALSTDLHWRRADEFSAMALRYLDGDFPRHQRHEASDLRQALELEPGFGSQESALLDLVAEAHLRDRELAAPVKEGLSRLASGGFPQNSGRFAIHLIQFAESLRRHIDWEEKVILPLAAERLPPEARHALLDSITAGGDRVSAPAFEYRN